MSVSRLDFGVFARSEISRRRALGIRTMAALCPSSEDLRVYDDVEAQSSPSHRRPLVTRMKPN